MRAHPSRMHPPPTHTHIQPSLSLHAPPLPSPYVHIYDFILFKTNYLAMPGFPLEWCGTILQFKIFLNCHGTGMCLIVNCTKRYGHRSRLWCHQACMIYINAKCRPNVVQMSRIIVLKIHFGIRECVTNLTCLCITIIYSPKTRKNCASISTLLSIKHVHI